MKQVKVQVNQVEDENVNPLLALILTSADA